MSRGVKEHPGSPGNDGGVLGKGLIGGREGCPDLPGTAWSESGARRFHWKLVLGNRGSIRYKHTQLGSVRMDTAPALIFPWYDAVEV